MLNVLLTGAGGRLGSKIVELGNDINFTALQTDILDKQRMIDGIEAMCRKGFYNDAAVDLLIHLAAYTSVDKAEVEKEKCYATNVIGTQNVVEACRLGRVPLLYLSTDYVFDGEFGNYREESIPNPINFYGLTKLLGEFIARQYFNRCIVVRTSFKPDVWPFEAAYEDVYTSADGITVIAQELLKLVRNVKSLKSTQGDAFCDAENILHIGTQRKTVLQLAQKSKPDIKGISISSAKYRVPRDVSLNTSKWEWLKKSFPGGVS